MVTVYGLNLMTWKAGHTVVKYNKEKKKEKNVGPNVERLCSLQLYNCTANWVCTATRNVPVEYTVTLLISSL